MARGGWHGAIERAVDGRCEEGAFGCRLDCRLTCRPSRRLDPLCLRMAIRMAIHGIPYACPVHPFCPTCSICSICEWLERLDIELCRERLELDSDSCDPFL